jgi:hypothetical protein
MGVDEATVRHWIVTNTYRFAQEIRGRLERMPLKDLAEEWPEMDDERAIAVRMYWRGKEAGRGGGDPQVAQLLTEHLAEVRRMSAELVSAKDAVATAKEVRPQGPRDRRPSRSWRRRRRRGRRVRIWKLRGRRRTR